MGWGHDAEDALEVDDPEVELLLELLELLLVELFFDAPSLEGLPLEPLPLVDSLPPELEDVIVEEEPLRESVR